jgi:DNA polymerase III subunit alpha
MSNFVHLHCHSDYSLYDGFQKPESLVDRVSELKMPAVALTDHGKLGGLIKLYKRCNEKKIKPLLGCEIYYVDNVLNKSEKRYHQTIIAKNNNGYKNLLRLNTESHKNLYRNFPLTDWKMLSSTGSDLIVTSGCTSSKMSEHCINGDEKGAEALARKSKEIWGDDYYFEVMMTGYEPQKKVVEVLSSLSKKLDIKIVATSDCHYTYKKDAPYQKIKISISRGGPLPPDYNQSDEYYVKSYEEMLSVFPDNPEWIHNTVEVAEKCNVTLNLGGAKLPDFLVPTDDLEFNDFRKMLWNRSKQEEYLIYLAEKGFKEKKFTYK